jgi:glycosyltransferase involved in cell wall biosynthesis
MGGEDASVEDEVRLLTARGHEVIRYTRHSGSIGDAPPLELAWRAVWNPQTYDEARALIVDERPDVVHCTNTFPLLSPSIYHAAKAEGVPVVQALRNYRLLCPSAVLFREGRICESCLGRRFAWPSIVHGCYHGNRMQTTVAAVTTAWHHLRGTWGDAVDLYYAPTEFARRRFVAAGMPAHRIGVKPNFVDPDPGLRENGGEYAVFVGRHAPEKGTATLVEAWRRLDTPLSLRFVGDGPLTDEVVAATRVDPRIEWLGPRSPSEVVEIMGNAALFVMPSLWYETFGRTIIEAFAVGTPVVATRLGAMAELVRDEETGLLAAPGDPVDFAGKIQRILDSATLRAELRAAARREYLEKYTANVNYRILMSLYDRAIRLGGARKARLG